MKNIFIFLSVISFAVAMTGCENNNGDDSNALPLVLSAAKVNLYIYGEDPDDTPPGFTRTVEIISGNGEYTITPNTETFYHSEAGRDIDFTISEEFVKAWIEGDTIVFERVKSIGHTPYGSYTISDRMGKTAVCEVATDRWLGDM